MDNEKPASGFSLESQGDDVVLGWSDEVGRHWARLTRERLARRLAWALDLRVEAVVAGFRAPDGGGLLEL